MGERELLWIVIAITFLTIIIRYKSHFWLIPAWLAPHKRLRVFFHRLRGVNIGKNVEIGYMVDIDHRYPECVHIGDNVTVVSQSMLLAHDNSYRYSRDGDIKISDVFLGKNVFIGGNSVILPGVKVGKHAIVGAGSVVTRDVDEYSIVVGNPAKKIQKKL